MRPVADDEHYNTGNNQREEHLEASTGSPPGGQQSVSESILVVKVPKGQDGITQAGIQVFYGLYSHPVPPPQRNNLHLALSLALAVDLTFQRKVSF